MFYSYYLYWPLDGFRSWMESWRIRLASIDPPFNRRWLAPQYPTGTVISTRHFRAYQRNQLPDGERKRDPGKSEGVPYVG